MKQLHDYAGKGHEWNKGRRSLLNGVKTDIWPLIVAVGKRLAQSNATVYYSPETVPTPAIVDHIAKACKKSRPHRQVIAIASDHDYLMLTRNVDGIYNPCHNNRNLVLKGDVLNMIGLSV